MGWDGEGLAGDGRSEPRRVWAERNASGGRWRPALRPPPSTYRSGCAPLPPPPRMQAGMCGGIREWGCGVWQASAYLSPGVTGRQLASGGGREIAEKLKEVGEEREEQMAAMGRPLDVAAVVGPTLRSRNPGWRSNVWKLLVCSRLLDQGEVRGGRGEGGGVREGVGGWGGCG